MPIIVVNGKQIDTDSKDDMDSGASKTPALPTPADETPPPIVTSGVTGREIPDEIPEGNLKPSAPIVVNGRKVNPENEPVASPAIISGTITQDDIEKLKKSYPNRSENAIRNYIAVYNNARTEVSNVGDTLKAGGGMIANFVGTNLLPMIVKRVVTKMDPDLDPKMIDDIEKMSSERESYASAITRNVGGFLLPLGMGERAIAGGIGVAGEALKGVGIFGKAAGAFPKLAGALGVEAIGGVTGAAYGAVMSREGEAAEGAFRGMLFGMAAPATFFTAGAMATPVAKALGMGVTGIDYMCKKAFGVEPGKAVANLWRIKPSEMGNALKISDEIYERDSGFYGKVRDTLFGMDKIGLDSVKELQEKLTDVEMDKFKGLYNITENVLNSNTNRYLKQLTGEKNSSKGFEKFKELMNETGRDVGSREDLKSDVEDMLISNALFSTRKGFVSGQLKGSREFQETLPYIELTRLSSPSGHELDGKFFIQQLEENPRMAGLVPDKVLSEFKTLADKGEMGKLHEAVDTFTAEKITQIKKDLNTREREVQTFRQTLNTLLNKGSSIEDAFRSFITTREFGRQVNALGGIATPIRDPFATGIVKVFMPTQKIMALLDNKFGTNLFSLHQMENMGFNKLAETSDRGRAAMKEIYGKWETLKGEMKEAKVNMQGATDRFTQFYENPVKYRDVLKPGEREFADKFKDITRELDEGRNKFYKGEDVEFSKYKSTFFDENGYIRHQAVDSKTALAKIRFKGESEALPEIEEILGNKSRDGSLTGILQDRGITSNQFKSLKAQVPAFGELVNAVSYLTDQTEIRGRQAFLGAYNKLWGTSVGTVEKRLSTEATAAYSRTSRRELPLMLRETDPVRLNEAHIFNTLKSAFVSPFQKEKAKIADKFRAMGQEDAANEVMYGISKANGGESPKIWQSLLKDTPQAAYKILRENGGNVDAIHNNIGFISNVVGGLHSIMYATALTGPHSIMQHLTQGGQTLFPSLARHNPVFAADVMCENLTNMALMEKMFRNNPQLIESGGYNARVKRLSAEGKIPEESFKARDDMNYRAVGETQSVSGKFRDISERASDSLLRLFGKGVEFGRIQASGAAQVVTRKAMNEDEAALQWLEDTGYSSINRELGPLLEREDWKAVGNVVERHLIQEVALVYNRNNMSMATRLMGPLFSPFSKWPMERIGEIGYSMMKGEEGQAVMKMLQPMMGFAAVQSLVDVMGEQDPKFRDNVSKLTGRKGFRSFDPNDAMYNLLNTLFDREGATKDKFGTTTVVNTVRDVAKGTISWDTKAWERVLNEDLYNMLMVPALVSRGEDWLNILRYNVPANNPASFRNKWRDTVKGEISNSLDEARNLKGSAYEEMIRDMSRGIFK